MQTLCPKDVAALLGIHPRLATMLLVSGQLAGWQIQGRGKARLWRTTREELDRYVRDQMTVTKPHKRSE